MAGSIFMVVISLKLVAATIGLFLHPLFILTGHLTAKSDVYSFGVVFLEMLSGRRAVDKNRPSGQHSLVDWAKPYLMNKRRMFRILDGRLDGQYSIDRAQRSATLALQCLTNDPRSRPNMDEVVATLEKLQDPKGTAKFTQKEQNLANSKNQPSGHATKAGRRTSQESSKAVVSYPRPSNSPFYKETSYGASI